MAHEAARQPYGVGPRLVQQVQVEQNGRHTRTAGHLFCLDWQTNAYPGLQKKAFLEAPSTRAQDTHLAGQQMQHATFMTQVV